MLSEGAVEGETPAIGCRASRQGPWVAHMGGRTFIEDGERERRIAQRKEEARARKESAAESEI